MNCDGKMCNRRSCGECFPFGGEPCAPSPDVDRAAPVRRLMELEAEIENLRASLRVADDAARALRAEVESLRAQLDKCRRALACPQ